MKRILKISFLIGLGVILGICLSYLPSIMYDTGNFMSSGPIILSSEDIRQKINAEGVEIPDEAYGLNYHWIAGIDHTCWYAFSASREKIEAFIGHAISNKSLQPSSNQSPIKRPYAWNNDAFDAKWWPRDFKKFKVYQGSLFWLGYDRMNQRVYVYSFSRQVEALTRKGTGSGNVMSVRAAAYHIAGHELHHVNMIKAHYLQVNVMITSRDEYFFDLYGYTIIPQALPPEHVTTINHWVDALPPLETGQWLGHVYVQSYGGVDGLNLQDIIEGGEIFERLIDHPAWIPQVRHYLGPSTTPYIYEIFINVREAGGYIGVHSGGHNIDHYQRSGRQNGQWVCPMISVLVPLTDVGPGDGATVVLPGSHKSDFPHPMQERSGGISTGPGETLEGAVEVHLKAGDALFFNDAICHGSAQRLNPGQRRMITIRYVPAMHAHRFGYEPSPELVARLTPERLSIVQHVKPNRSPNV